MSEQPTLGIVRQRFSATRLLLRMWHKWDTNQPVAAESMHLCQVDGARVRYHAIPSIFD